MIDRKFREILDERVKDVEFESAESLSDEAKLFVDVLSRYAGIGVYVNMTADRDNGGVLAVLKIPSLGFREEEFRRCTLWELLDETVAGVVTDNGDDGSDDPVADAVAGDDGGEVDLGSESTEDDLVDSAA